MLFFEIAGWDLGFKIERGDLMGEGWDKGHGSWFVFSRFLAVKVHGNNCSVFYDIFGVEWRLVWNRSHRNFSINNSVKILVCWPIFGHSKMLYQTISELITFYIGPKILELGSNFQKTSFSYKRWFFEIFSRLRWRWSEPHSSTFKDQHFPKKFKIKIGPAHQNSKWGSI